MNTTSTPGDPCADHPAPPIAHPDQTLRQYWTELALYCLSHLNTDRGFTLADIPILYLLSDEQMEYACIGLTDALTWPSYVVDDIGTPVLVYDRLALTLTIVRRRLLARQAVQAAQDGAQLYADRDQVATPTTPKSDGGTKVPVHDRPRPLAPAGQRREILF